MQHSRAVLTRVAKLQFTRPISISCVRNNRSIPPAEYAAIKDFTEKVVDTAALPEPPEGWTHTPSLRDVEKRLGKKIETVNSNVRAPSVEKNEFDGAAMMQSVDLGDWSQDDSASGETFTPGTFVELRRNEQYTHGVVLGELPMDGRIHVITLVSSGEVWNPQREDVMFAVPALAPPDVARRCGMSILASDEVQQNARIKVMQHIRQIERAVEIATADITRSNIDVYSIVKSRDPNEWASTTVAEVARLFSRKPTLVVIFAAHKYLMDKNRHFVAGHGYLLSQSFDVRPESHIQIIKSVTEWSRQRIGGPIQDFAKRAMPVIQANKQLHSDTRLDVPSQQPTKHTWTPNDITIFEFLHQSLQPVRAVQVDPFSIGQSAIIRALDPDGKVDDHQVHMALVNLGVYAPWQDVFSLRHGLNLDLEDPKTSSRFQATEALVQRALSAPSRSGPLGPEDFYPSDPLDHLRHDLGDTPIYVIDDEGSQELDDGVSVEAIPGEPDSYWLHVHIADPASTVPPTHILAQRAAKMSQTAYFVHRTWPLFPKSLMFSKRAGFSLSSQNENRVLTFSSKINSNGELVDCVVRPGIGRNFLILAYDEVDLALTGKIAPRSYPFGIPPPPPPKPQLSERHMNDLRTLTMIQHRVMKNRVAQGIIEPNAEAPNFKRFVPAENIESPIMRSSEFRGFPQFDYYVADMTTSAATARGLVAESMRLACRTASRWCTERGVNVIRRIGSPLVVTPTAEEQLLSMRDENGFVDIAHITALATSLPTAENSLTPGAHWGMGIREGEGYTRATSPLRRFADLIGHYQIHRALLGEKPYFSRTYLEDHLKWLKHDDQLKKRTETLHQRFWVLMALRRWLEAPRTDIPDPLSNLEAIIMRQVRFNTVTNSFQAEVRIPRLGISGFLENISLRRRGDWVISRTIPVKFQELLLGVRPRLVLSEPNKKPDSLI